MIGARRMGSRRGRNAPMAEINVTPFVDVMLVLLIIFMVTAPLLVAGVAVDLPDSKAGPLEPEEKPVEITLDAGGALFIDSEPVADAGFAAALARIAAAAPVGSGGPRIFLRADRSIDYGRVIGVMGEINRAGLRKLALVSTAGEGAPR